MSTTEYYENEYNQLNNIFLSMSQTTLCIITGDYGSGKSTLIQHFLQTFPQKKIFLREIADSIDIYYSLKKAIDNNQTESITDTIYNVNSDICYATAVTGDFISLCQKNPRCCLWIDDITSFNSPKMLKNIYEILKILLFLNAKLNIFIIIECSKDKLTDDSRSIFYDIRSLVKTNTIIEIPKLESKLLIHYFMELFNQPVSISIPMIKHICKSAFNNFLLIKRYVEYLKDNQIIYQQNGFWYCGDVDPIISYTLLKQPIQNRFEKLDNNLKQVLQKASITGVEIDTKLMKRPLLVPIPEQKLNVIEKISKLVEKTYDTFSFETEEVHCHVTQSIDENLQIELHKLLAEYLDKDISSLFYKESVYEARNKSFKIAQHYECCGEYRCSFQFYIVCISYSTKIKDFDSVIKCCTKALQISEIVEVNDCYMQFVFWNIALAYEKLSEFDRAAENYLNITAYNKNTPKMYNDFLISYHYGYCLRRAGHTDEAYSNLDTLRKNLLAESDEYHKQILVQTLIVLIGILDQLGKVELKERYFNYCLSLSEHFEEKSLYYELLSKSSLYYDSQIAMRLMHKAFKYFDNHNKRFETAKAAFNLGMSEIYSYNFANATHHISYAYEIFSTYGGNNICYPTCGLGIIAATNGDYVNAIEYFNAVIQFSTNDFSRIVASINLCHCYRKIKNYKLAYEKLEIANSILNNQPDDKLVLMRNYYFAKAMMFYNTPYSNYSLALELIKKALDIEVNQLKYHTYNVYLAKWIMKLSKCINKECSNPQIIKLSLGTLTQYKQICYDNSVMWGNFMFW